jgi:hypothetical protein
LRRKLIFFDEFLKQENDCFSHSSIKMGISENIWKRILNFFVEIHGRIKEEKELLVYFI